MVMNFGDGGNFKQSNQMSPSWSNETHLGCMEMLSRYLDNWAPGPKDAD